MGIKSFKKRHSAKRLKNDLIFMAALAQYIILLISIIALFRPIHFTIDLTAHFRFQYLLISIASLVAFCTLKKKKVVISALLAIFINSYLIYPYYFHTTPASTAKTSSNNSRSVIRVMMTNVYTKNNQKSEFINQIKKLNPDILVLQEINKQWKNELETLKNNYKFFIHETREDNFGIGILSRIPITDYIIKPFREDYPPSISVKLKYQNKKIHLIASHPVPPVSSLQFDMRNQQLVDIAEKFRKEDADYQILAGDLNVSPWSYYFKKLTFTSQLRDSRLGYGYSPSWPTYRRIMYIPIDYILLSQNIQVENFQTENILGSDHKAVISDISLN